MDRDPHTMCGLCNVHLIIWHILDDGPGFAVVHKQSNLPCSVTDMVCGGPGVSQILALLLGSDIFYLL